MRRPAVPLLPSLALLAACGGDGLTLPGDHIPAKLTIVAGDAQQAPIGAQLPDPLIVAVADIEDRPVAGASVQFRFPDDPPDASVLPGTAPTGADGRASASVRLGQRVGPQVVEAIVAAPGEDLRVRFEAMANALSGGGGGGNSGGGGGSGGGSTDGGSGGGSTGDSGGASGGSGGGGDGGSGEGSHGSHAGNGGGGGHGSDGNNGGGKG